MRFCVIDFETRSTIDLTKQGLFVYANPEYTEIMCCAFLFNDEELPRIWINPKFSELIDPANINYPITGVCPSFDSVEYVVAQQSMFEYMIWNEIAVPVFKWKPLSMEKLHDTKAQLAYYALPLNLDDASRHMGLAIKKDMEGHKAMLRLCKPRRPKKAERVACPDWESRIFWDERPHLLERNFNYCCTDVLTERLVHTTLPDIPSFERDVWLLDQRINLRGIPVDLEGVRAVVGTVNSHKEELEAQFSLLTDGAVSSARSYVALKNWIIRETGIRIKSVDKAATEEMLNDNRFPGHVKQILSIKSQLGKSSVAKLQAILDRASDDSRVRGWSVYHGATTGRWSASGIQPHNFPRDCYSPEEFEAILHFFKAGDVEGMSALWDDPFRAASKCIRPVILAKDGYKFYCTDFSAIEGRGLAYLAGEDWVVEAYRKGVGMYELSAAEIFGVEYDKVTKSQRAVGKVAELALGYYGGIGAFAAFAIGYRIDLETLPYLILPSATTEELDGPYGAYALAEMYLKKNPGAMSLHAAVACDVIKRKWRAARPMIVAFWNQIEKAAVNAIENPGKVFSYRGIRYCVNRGFLKCQLPSGRVMHYFRPSLDLPKELDDPSEEVDWKDSKKQIRFYGMRVIQGKTVRQWAKLHTFGGRLAENIVQGFCRDLLAEAMLRHEAAGYKIVMDVHDEDVAEVPESFGSLEEFNRIAEIVPPWAAGMPIKAAGWEGKRYRK